MFELRYYQREAVDALMKYYVEDRKTNNVAIELPTGAGKSVVIAAFIDEICNRFKSSNIRVMQLTHTKELVLQNYKTFKNISNLDAGIYSAGLNKRDVNKQVTFASIQSVCNNIDKVLKHGSINIVIIDECHAVSKNSNTRYQILLNAIKKDRSTAKIIGFTATPYRLDSGLITSGPDKIFSSIIYRHDIKKMIADGYLSNIVTEVSETQIDTSKVSIRGGEYLQRELETASNDPLIYKQAVKDALEKCGDRRSWLVFCASVKHAKNVHKELEDAGICSAVVSGEMKADERDQVIKDFKEFKIKALVNVNVLTTGFDHKAVDLIICLRPTCSKGLWMQIVGRGLRIHPEKQDCLLLDYSGNNDKLGPVDCITVDEKDEKRLNSKRVLKTFRLCKQCYGESDINSITCEHCGCYLKVDRSAPKLYSKNSDSSVLSDTKTYIVKSVKYSKHLKKGSSTPTLKVTYKIDCSMFAGNEVNDFICFEHAGFAKEKAKIWWSNRTALTAPTTVDDALELQEFLDTPRMLLVDISGKYKRVISSKF